MTEHPLFVPIGPDHLGAVLTLPDGAARGLVLLLPALEARSQRDRLWTWTARAFAEQGIAAVRMDYLGVGDSTGAPYGGPSPGEQALAVCRTVLDGTGVPLVGIVGHCRGVQTALAVAGELEQPCRIACVIPPFMIKRHTTRLRRSLAGRVVRRLARASGRLVGRRPPPFRPWYWASWIPDRMVAKHVLFLMVGADRRLPRMQRFARSLSRTHESGGSSFEARVLDIPQISAFRVPRHVQPAVIAQFTEWIEAAA